MSLLSLPEEIASELAWSREGDDEHNVEYVAHVDAGQSRWSNDWLVVFCFHRPHREELYGFHWFQPATEEQDGAEQFENNAEGHVVVFPVIAREETVTVYERAPGVPS